MFINIKEHVEIFGKRCYNCALCCADQEDETTSTEFWCQDFKRKLMHRIAALHSYCDKWIIREEKD